MAARYVFDYKLPQNSISFTLSLPCPQLYPKSIKEKKADQVLEIYIISPVKGNIITGLKPYPKVEFFSKEFNTIPSQPLDVVMIK